MVAGLIFGVTGLAGMVLSNTSDRLSVPDTFAESYIDNIESILLKPEAGAFCDKLENISEATLCKSETDKRNTIRKSEKYKKAVEKYVSHAKSVKGSFSMHIPPLYINHNFQSKVNIVRVLEMTSVNPEMLSQTIDVLERRMLLNNVILFSVIGAWAMGLYLFLTSRKKVSK